MFSSSPSDKFSASQHSSLHQGIPMPKIRAVRTWPMEGVCKRDGRIVPFQQERVANAIFRAAKAVGGSDKEESWRVSDLACEQIAASGKRFPTVEEIQDIVERVLIMEGHATTAKAYILYRAKRAELRYAAAEAAKQNDPERQGLLEMFAYKGKLVSIIGYDRIDAYKNLLFFLKDLQAQGKVPTHPQGNYLNNNELASNIFQKKYYLKDLRDQLLEKRPEDLFARLAAFTAAVEPDEKRAQIWAEEFYRSLYEGYFVPGGRVIAGAGDLYRLKTLANCFVSLLKEDNLEAIYQAAYECARTYSYGGGIGVDISALRPAGALVHNAASHSTGAVSFMELYSLTTGLIGQAGRRGALMITLDIKHPDAPTFARIKKVSNWTTKQIAEQASMSGKFSPEQVEEIERQVRENTQVRHANISLKMSDEFMRAVEEQNEYGPDTILIYEKDKSVSSLGVAQGGEVNYSYGIPSKPIERYTLQGSFASISELNAFLAERGCQTVMHAILADEAKRDMFGDFIIPMYGAPHDFAVKYAGDFMLYFNSQETGEVKRLIKARELWDAFVEGNYRTAEPGLIFWTRMTRFSPSNYVGRPIASTNPCVTGDTLVWTKDGLFPIRELVGREPSLLLDKQQEGRAGAVWQTGIKDVYTLMTKEGFCVRATADHRIMTRQGWKSLSVLRVGDKVKIGELASDAFSIERGSYEEGMTLGWLAGDGHLNAERSVLYFYGSDKQEVLTSMRIAVAAATGRELSAVSNGVCLYLRSRGITNLATHYGAITSRFPERALGAGKEFQRGFLRALFTADGSIQGTALKGYSVRLTSVDFDALQKTQLMLLGFGIYSVIYRNRRAAGMRPMPDGHGGLKEYYCKACHDLMISSTSIVNFAREIGFLSSIKQERLKQSIASLSSRGPYRERWEATVESVAPSGTEPVYDLTEPATHSFVANGIVAHNCGEIPLEDGGACNLGSINLSRFVRGGYTGEATIDWDGIAKTSMVITRFLDNVVTWNETLNALEKQRKAARETRRLGIGVMGIADMLNQLGLAYDSDEGIRIMEEVMRFVANAVYRASADLAEEKGPSPIFDYEPYARGEFFQQSLTSETREIVRQKGLRNVALLSIAPTGTISNIPLSYKIGDKNFIGVSGGIEPIFALYYTRRSESFGNQMFKVFHSTVDAYIQEHNLTEQVKEAKSLEDLKSILPAYFFRTAHTIAPDKRVAIQGVCQQYIDHSISSTVNLAEDIEPEVISNIYLDAWRKGLKGITIYREGSRFAILTVEGTKNELQEWKGKIFSWDGKTLRGDDVISLPNGRLTTVFHAVRGGFMRVGESGALQLTEAAMKREVAPVSVEDDRDSDIRSWRDQQRENVGEYDKRDLPRPMSDEQLFSAPSAPHMNTAFIPHTASKTRVASWATPELAPEQAKPALTQASTDNQMIFIPGARLMECPACSQHTLKMEAGCNTCMNEECGWGQCEA